MPIKKYTDWRTWLEGFYDSWMDSLTSTALAFAGSNTLGQVPGLHSLGLNLQQAGGIFLSVTFWSMVRYLQTHKRPQVITETTETTHFSQDATGHAEGGSSKTVVTTPIETKDPYDPKTS